MNNNTILIEFAILMALLQHILEMTHFVTYIYIYKYSSEVTVHDAQGKWIFARSLYTGQTLMIIYIDNYYSNMYLDNMW